MLNVVATAACFGAGPTPPTGSTDGTSSDWLGLKWLPKAYLAGFWLGSGFCWTWHGW